MASKGSPPGALGEVARFFLRLGLTAFGGPAAHIAMMEDEVVRRRRWLGREAFLDLLGAVSLVPGPNSTEMAIFLGFRRAGWPGLLLGGVCFIGPAAFLTLGFAWAYVRFGSLPRGAALLYGVKPVIIAVVLQALLGLGRSAIRSPLLAAVALSATAAALLGWNPLGVLLAAGGVAAAARWNGERGGKGGLGVALPGLPLWAPFGVTAAAAAVSVSRWGLFLVFLKVGAVLYGSGYVLLAFLRDDLVARLHWLTESQLLDAVAVGQLTPGPVFTTATFIGYLLGGGRGAFLATLGIFLPSFFFVALSGPLVPALRRSPLAGSFLDGVNVGSLALMAAVTGLLARSALVDLPTALLAALSALLLVRFRVNPSWLVLGGGLLGLARGGLS